MWTTSQSPRHRSAFQALVNVFGIVVDSRDEQPRVMTGQPAMLLNELATKHNIKFDVAIDTIDGKPITPHSTFKCIIDIAGRGWYMVTSCTHLHFQAHSLAKDRRKRWQKQWRLAMHFVTSLISLLSTVTMVIRQCPNIENDTSKWQTQRILFNCYTNSVSFRYSNTHTLSVYNNNILSIIG